MRRRLSSRVMGQILEEPRFLGGDRRPAHSRPTTLHNNVLQILHTSIEDILSSNVRAQFSPSQRLEGGGGGGDLANSFQRGSLDHVIDRAPPKEGCPLRWRNQARKSEVWISSMLAGKMCKATLRQPRRRRRRRRRKTRRKEARGLRPIDGNKFFTSGDTFTTMLSVTSPPLSLPALPRHIPPLPVPPLPAPPLPPYRT